MSALHTFALAIYLAQIFAAAFLAILFLQSGIDKVADRRGNLEWLKGHFAKSPFAGSVPALLTIITILETAAGALSAIGCVLVILLRDSTIAFYGAVISAVAIVESRNRITRTHPIALKAPAAVSRIVMIVSSA